MSDELELRRQRRQEAADECKANLRLLRAFIIETMEQAFLDDDGKSEQALDAMVASIINDDFGPAE